MKLLLDTHIAIWLDSNIAGISPEHRRALEDPQNTLHLSAATAWEIGTKVAKGSLKFTHRFSSFIKRYDLIEVPITAAHAEEATLLPLYHRDPFDRMLVAQARLEGMAIVDAEIRRYPVTCM